MSPDDARRDMGNPHRGLEDGGILSTVDGHAYV